MDLLAPGSACPDCGHTTVVHPMYGNPGVKCCGLCVLEAANQPTEGLTGWWRDTADSDLAMVVPKAEEYGSRDLMEMGRTLARVSDRTVDDAEATELGVWFYALGKMARWTAAVERGERVSTDTLMDLGVYSIMARRVRETGSWPGNENGETK